MYFKKKDNSTEAEHYLKQDGKWSTKVLILDDYCCDISNVKRDSFYTIECVNEEFEPCSKSEFDTGFKKAMSILKSQIL